MRWRTAVTHGKAGTAKLMARGGPGNAQLCTDLAQRPTLRVQVGCTLNVHRATVTWRRVRRILLAAEGSRLPEQSEPLNPKSRIYAEYPGQR
jgi:hypothetical protein